jgi:hypothetical protein
LEWPAAYTAFRVVPPEMPEEQAKLETTQAIAFAGGEPYSLVLERRVRLVRSSPVETAE